jgi:hypothetical protein
MLGTANNSVDPESAPEFNLTGTKSSARSIDQIQNLNNRLKQNVKSFLPPILLNSVICLTPTWWNWIGVDRELFIILIYNPTIQIK